MLQKHDRPDDRMEALLRLWGADQAAQEQNLPPAPPVLKPVRLDLRYALLCAGCVAAGAIVAIGALLIAQRSGKISTQEDQYEAYMMPADQYEELADAAETPREPHVTPVPESKTPDSTVQTLKKDLKEMEFQRDQALLLASQADTKKKQLAEEKGELQKQLDQAKRVKEAVTQLDRRIEALRKEQDEALAMANRLRKQLATSREQHQAKYQQTLEVYLTAVAPQQQGLEAIQTASRTSHLLRRCAALRAKETDDNMRKLLDRIEAVLIRMDFIDTKNVTNMYRFERQLRHSDLLPKISAALPRTSQNRDLQIFLAEVDLILSGVQRVG